MQKDEAGSYLTPYTKIDSKWITVLIIRAKIITLLDENRGKHRGIGFRNNFLDMIPKA